MLRSSIKALKMLILLLVTSAAAQIEPKIVGGELADIKDWSFIALITIFSESTAITCGGTLLSSQTVLTAAHCLDDVTHSKKNFDDYNFSVLMGNSEFSKSTMIRFVMNYQTHHRYYESKSEFDIGIMFLWKPVTFSDNVKKVLLLKKLNPVQDRLLMVAGWGAVAWSEKISETQSTSPFLKSLAQTLMSNENCQSVLEEDAMEGVFCAGDPDYDAFAYSGDSGGPLVKAGLPIQVGIVSFRIENHGVTVYTSIPYYYDWIEDTQWRMFLLYCPKKKEIYDPDAIDQDGMDQQDGMDLNLYD